MIRPPLPDHPDVIRDEVVLFILPDGRHALGVLLVIPEAAPYRVREGIARRRIVATTGRCPCGATVDYGATTAAGYSVAEVAHESLCPAGKTRLLKAIRRWTS